jgi:isoquinoline 1-oxidoreductase beta subunit
MSETQSTHTKPVRKRRITRRRFLIGLGTGAAALAVGAVVGGPTIVREARLRLNQAFLTGQLPLPALPKSPFVWLEIKPDGSTHLYPPKIEMGQGIHTTLAQIAADELELDWQTVVVHQADTARGFDANLLFTFGSTSTTSLYKPIREIAATMREMLRTEAAKQMKVDAAQLMAENSIVASKADPTKKLTYGAIIAAKQGEWIVPDKPPALKPKEALRLIGQPVKRVDLSAKVTGQAIFGYDARLPNMLYGAVARPPRYDAKLVKAAPGDAQQQPGVIAVVIQDGFAGIVAESRRQAYAALEHLDLTWEGGTSISQAEIETLVSVPAQGSGVLIQREGDVDANIGRGTLVTAEYRTPMAAHAHMEPQAALVDAQNGKVTVYASTQSPGLTRDFVAKALKVDAKIVDVIPTYLGGGFGRKTGTDVAVEAALLSKAAGRPVHVGWNRTEDMRYGYRRPPAHNVLRASVENGKIVAMEHQLASSDVFFYVQNLQGSGFLETMLGADPLAAYGALIHYNIPNARVIYHHRRLPVPTAFWRGLGSFPNTFAIETFLDEVAATAKIDPLELRRSHLPKGDLGKRLSAVLDTVAKASGWGTPPPAGRARGLTATYDRGTVVGLVVEASVEKQMLRVHRAWCAVDPGLVVNPDGAAAQVQGSIIMALSSTLYERITVKDGLVTNENFNQYPLLTMRDAPDIQVIPINSSDEPIGGLGEPVVGTVPAAVSNAVFALTGQRLRAMPFRLA